MIGKTVSHYEILDRLGSGGMGVVYRARDLRLERIVALKFLPEHSAAQPDARERFLREARSAALLDHPAIAVIHEVDETEDGEIFIAMACYEGETVKDRIARGPLSADEAIAIGTAVAEGLEAAHRQGIVHRDIKPANVFLTRDGGVKILDFGLAKQQGGGTLTLSGDTLGTAAYMSPEQISGQAVDARTDLWSLGAMLHEMVSGSPPFPGSTIPARLHAILNEPPDNPPGDLPGALRAAIGHALEKNPDERYDSATALLEDLRRAKRDEEPTRAFRATKPKVGQSLRRLAPVLLAVAAAAAIGLWVVTERRADRPRDESASIAVLPFENLTGDDGKAYLARGLSAGLVRALSEVAGLQVVGRSVVGGAPEEEDAEEFAQRLGVAHLLEGDLQAGGDTLRVTVNLLDAASGVVLWSNQFSEAEDAVLELQQRIATALTGLLRVRVSPHERRRLDRNATRSFRAYDYYLRGEEKLDERDYDAAVTLFEQATQTDPEFALAYAGASAAHWKRFARQAEEPDLEAAEELADRALELDPALPDAIVARALVLRSRGRLGDSVAEVRRVLSTHPKPAEAQVDLAAAYESIGDLEAAEKALRNGAALEPGDWFQWNVLGTFLTRHGSYDAAAEALDRAVVLAPVGNHRPRMNRAALRILQGDFEGAIEEFEATPEQIRIASVASNLGTAYYFSDRPDRWEKAEEHYLRAAELAPDNHTVRRNLGDLYLTLDRPDEAEEQYRAARAAVERRLRVEHEQADLRLFRALYAAKAGDCPTALDEAGHLLELLPETGPNGHDLAMVHALCRRPTVAIELLAAAIERGFPSSVIAQEDEFASLRGTEGYRRLGLPSP